MSETKEQILYRTRFLAPAHRARVLARHGIVERPVASPNSYTLTDEQLQVLIRVTRDPSSSQFAHLASMSFTTKSSAPKPIEVTAAAIIEAGRVARAGGPAVPPPKPGSFADRVVKAAAKARGEISN